MTLDSDPRWRRFNDTDTPCACCGRVFQGVFDIGYDHPDPWPHGNLAETGQDEMTVGEDMLTADLCTVGPHRFIRAILTLPIIGTDQTFSFGPWGSVNPQNFELYKAGEAGGAPFEGCFSWLTNLLPGTGMTEHLACDLLPAPNPDHRPELAVHDGPTLAEWQENGITFDQLLDIYAAAGNDIRPHLLDS